MYKANTTIAGFNFETIEAINTMVAKQDLEPVHVECFNYRLVETGKV